MADSQSPFVATALNPQRIGGNSKFYELTSSSVTPTKTYVDIDGNVIEERIPVHYSQEWVMPNGCINNIPMRTSAVFSMEPIHAVYEQTMSADLIRGGAMPLSECPWTNKYSFITGGTLARSKTPGEDCGGAPKGCSHMQAAMASRKATALKKFEEQERLDNAKSEKDILKMAKTIGVVMGEMQSAAPPSTPKAK